MPEVFVGRQPIYDKKLEVFAYELLFRSGEDNWTRVEDDDKATSQIILNTFLEIGLDRIAGPHRVFINVGRSFLLGEFPIPLPQDRIGLEILEDVTVDERLVEGVRALAAKGHLIALDDFVLNDDTRPLLDLADIIKIDISTMNRATLAQHVATLRPWKSKLLAEKVETQEEFEFCRQLGFDYFQGYFFCRPSIVKGQRIPANRLAILRLLAKLQDPSTTVKELEEIISHDVSLSYKLLRYINSAAFALTRRIDSIKQAVIYLGTQTIKHWVILFALSGINDKPHELMVTALVRARMGELLARALAARDPDVFFTVGLFSTLDALMDMPMARVVESLPLSEAVSLALLEQAGPYGQVLRCILAYEREDWDRVKAALPLANESIRDAYLQAITWADEVGASLRA